MWIRSRKVGTRSERPRRTVAAHDRVGFTRSGRGAEVVLPPRRVDCAPSLSRTRSRAARSGLGSDEHRVGELRNRSSLQPPPGVPTRSSAARRPISNGCWLTTVTAGSTQAHPGQAVEGREGDVGADADRCGPRMALNAPCARMLLAVIKALTSGRRFSRASVLVAAASARRARHLDQVVVRLQAGLPQRVPVAVEPAGAGAPALFVEEAARRRARPRSRRCAGQHRPAGMVVRHDHVRAGARPAGRSAQTIGSPNCLAVFAIRSLTGVTITPPTRIDAKAAIASASFAGSLSSLTSSRVSPRGGQAHLDSGGEFGVVRVAQVGDEHTDRRARPHPAATGVSH